MPNALTPNKQQIVELRNLFIQRYKANPPSVPFHPIDLKRIYDNDIWLIKFLETYDLDVKVSLEKLWFTCKWRQEFKAYDLCEDDLREDYLTDGAIFMHNHDIDGKPLLIFQTKNHIKGAKNLDDITRIVVYYVERLHRQTNMDKITLFFDMTGTGLANMDIDFIRCIIDTFKLYYPNALNYILVFEMAWILNAAFKVIKALLPEKAQAILKVIKKKDINSYVDKDNCLISWGGNDNYTFKFVPEIRSSEYKEEQKPSGEVTEKYNVNNYHNDLSLENYNDNNNNIDNNFNGLDKKMVHFANGSPKSGATNDSNVNDTKTILQTQEERMLRLVPNDLIVFARVESPESSIQLQNICKCSVTYKIQTTSPEKFRVRPRCGVLKPGDSAIINILLKSDHVLSENAKDKFLIMSLPASDLANIQQISEFWRKQNVNASNIEQHRLCCVYRDAVPSGGGAMDKPAINLSGSHATINQMTITADLERQLRCTQVLQVITLICLLLLSGAVIYLLMLQLCGDIGCFTKDATTDTSGDEAEL